VSYAEQKGRIMNRVHPVILCGGSGTRLWPRSRKAKPKPFLPLVGSRTLFQQSLDRASDPARFAAPIIIAGSAHVHPIEAQFSKGDGSMLVVEPGARNTAPAIALAAHALPPEAIMLVCPSDHHIADVEAFCGAVDKAAALANDDWMVSIGIAPTAPETGYGYIKRGAALGLGNKVDRFVEKPDRKRAEEFLADGGFVWNAGIFAFRAGAFLEELARHRPEMASGVAQSYAGAQTKGWQCLPAAKEFLAIEGESVDYAVMENTARAAVVAGDMGWSDIGNWEALMEARQNLADDKLPDDKTVAIGTADFIDCRNVMAESDGPRVSVIGLENVVVVVDGDEVLVTSLDGAQSVGKLPGAAKQ
jgi:mannose-1-phosphate guanylyltransferase/mannose-6-phosphate isomerase